MGPTKGVPSQLRVLIAALGSVLLLISHTPGHIKADQEGDTALSESDFVPGQLIVTFADGRQPKRTDVNLDARHIGVERVDRLLKQHKSKGIRKFIPSYGKATSRAGSYLERTYILHFPITADVLAIKDQLERLNLFETVETNGTTRGIVLHGVVRRFEPGASTAFDKQWYFDHATKDSVDIDMPEAWAIERGDGDIVIGIIDTGTMVDTTFAENNWYLHDDFNFLWIDEEDSCSSGKLNGCDLDSLDNDSDGIIDNIVGHNFEKIFDTDNTPGAGYRKRFWRALPLNWLRQNHSWNVVAWRKHGVHVSSIAAATAAGTDIVGAANQSKVYVLRAGLNQSNWVHESDAILHASSYCDVINMSWGIHQQSDPSTLLRNAVESAAQDSNSVLVASVGNEGSSSYIAWPARYPDVLAVGSLDSLLTLSPYSNYGSIGQVNVVAPVDSGVWAGSHSDCVGSYPCVTSETTELTGYGTSFAAPQAAGVAALVRSRFPGLDQAAVRARIERSAEYYWSSASTDSQKYGAGKINAYRALTEWGHVTSDTAWGATTGMPDTLYVAGDLIIDSDVTLTLNKGTVVRVAGGDVEGDGTDTGKTEIVVKGDLKVGSVGSGPIVFESFVDGTQGNDDWIGIRFENASSSDSLAGVTVRNAKVGIQVDSGVMTLSDCTIKDCQTGIKVLDAAVTVDTCTVRGASSYGLSVVSGDSMVTVKRSTFKDNDVGIYSADTTTTMIDACTIDSCGVGIEAYRNHNVTIAGCTITNSTTDGVYAHTSSNIKVEGCTITDNVTGVLAVDCHPRIWTSSAVKDNTTGIKCDDYADAVVESTTVTGNSVGIAAVNNSDPDLGHESGGSSSGYNIIHTSSSHHVTNLTVGVTIKAENNYWKGKETGWVTCQCEPKSSKISGAVDFCSALCSAPTLSSPYVGGPPGGDPELPTVYSLSQNYPNPFNPTTMLRYEVPAPGGLVRVNVYNVRGQLVRTLLDEHMAAGVHTVAWDGVNKRGESVATGVYFVNMTAPGFTVTRKLVLVK